MPCENNDTKEFQEDGNSALKKSRTQTNLNHTDSTELTATDRTDMTGVEGSQQHNVDSWADL